MTVYWLFAGGEKKEDEGMVKLYEGGAYLVNGTEIIADGADQEEILKKQDGKRCV